MRAALASLAALLALAGCAKFPSDGSTDFTRLNFRFTVDGRVNPNYQYFVAIRLITADQTDTQTNGPIPVVSTGSKNGFVEGSPTHYVQYDPAGSIEAYTIHRFLPKTEAPDDSDTNPINLGAQEIVGQPLSGTDPNLQGNDPQLFQFELSLQDLCRNAAGAQLVNPSSVVAIQFNILTMNRTALNGGDIGSRVIDALGNQHSGTTFNNWKQVPLTTSRTYTNGEQSPIDQETADDTYNGTLPDIDLTDWSLEVRTP